jgi:hypothetical protein
MLGQVPSPTPIAGTSGDSIKVTCSGVPRCSAAIRPAVSQPADPPPTITMRSDHVIGHGVSNWVMPKV